MRSRTLFAAAALFACTAGIAAALTFQDKSKSAPSQDKAKAAPAAAPAAGEPDPEMMKKWMAYMTPGAEHKVLDAMAGKWTTKVRFWMDPAAQAQESQGTCEISWIMGGRYLQEMDKGEAMGMPFEGMGLTAFDNLKKKYLGTWIDNMGTGIMVSTEGTYDPASKSITSKTEGPDATMSKYVPMRMVRTMIDANTHKMEMFGPDKSGKEFRSFECTYTRAK
jgi:hypothetical protein